MSLFSNIRFYVLLSTAVLASLIYFQTRATVTAEVLNIKLVEYYALMAVVYLYFTLLASPVTRLFTFLPSSFRGRYLKARRAIGVSAFIFALLHASLAFFTLLGGFEGLFLLPGDYLVSVSLGAISLFILTLMALTASEFMVEKLSFPRWKMLHRLVYLVAVLTIIHALRLGSHFQDLSETIPQIFAVAIFFLLFLESIRFDQYLQTKFLYPAKFSLVLIILSFILGGIVFFYLIPPNAPISLGIHSQHIQLAQQAQNQTQNNLPNIPGLQGDKTKKFNVNFNQPQGIMAGQEVDLNFDVYDGISGYPTYLFSTVYEKPMHLIIVNNKLSYFNHVHPEQRDQNRFSIKASFPEEGQYHLYLDFQPFGAIEQQVGFLVNVGQIPEGGSEKNHSSDFTQVKNFDNYEVSLDYPKPLKSAEISLGKQLLKFTIKDLNGKPVTNLKPYLASFGHLVMINQDTFDYIHVHPTNLVAPKPDETSGPGVEFMPLGLYGPIKSGTYKVFGQFNPGGELITTDFTVEVL